MPISRLFKGASLSRGIARGRAYVLATAADRASPKRAVLASEVPAELSRLKAALGEAHLQLTALQKNLRERLGVKAADIFNAQVLVLQDPTFVEEIVELVKGRMNAEAAVSAVIEKYALAIEGIEDVYMRERAADIRDVGRRVLGLLLEERPVETIGLPEGTIIVADELQPSVTAHLEVGKIRGFITEKGGKTSHAAILARSNGVPAVSGIAEAASRIKTGDDVIVDAFAGGVLLHPKPSVVREYEKLEEQFKAYRESLKGLVDLPARTKDGVTVKLLANIGKIADAEAAVLFGADGVGLYRTEFAFMIRSEFPTEEEQFANFKAVAERFHPRPVVCRVLDLGGDKVLPYFPLPREPNPALGERGIRLLLKHKEILKTQLRAMLRASAGRSISILLPMVSGVEEAEAARRLLEEAKAELRSEGKAFDPKVRLGAMIETPAAVLLAPRLAKIMDFFSLGTNDLTQYVLAADRQDPEMETFYQPLHPAVLKSIRQLVQDAEAAGTELTLCGDIAGDPMLTPLLIGLGLRSFSAAPAELLEVKSAVRSCDTREAAQLARRALACGTIKEVLALIHPASPPVPGKAPA